MWINPEVKDLFSFEFEDFRLENYVADATIRRRSRCSLRFRPHDGRWRAAGFPSRSGYLHAQTPCRGLVARCFRACGRERHQAWRNSARRAGLRHDPDVVSSGERRPRHHLRRSRSGRLALPAQHRPTDVEAIVAFPMPDIASSPYENVSIPDTASDNFLDFKVAVDGKELKQRSINAFAVGIDVTDTLKNEECQPVPLSGRHRGPAERAEQADRQVDRARHHPRRDL